MVLASVVSWVMGTNRSGVPGEAGGLHQFLGGRRAPQPLVEQRGRPSEPVEVGGPVERHPDRPPMTRNRGLDGLPDPPDGIRNELDAPVRVELPRGGHESEVPLTDEVHEGDPAVLELLGHRDHEAHVVPGQFFLGFHVTPEGTARQGGLLLDGEQGDSADLLEVEIQTLPAFIDRPGKLRGVPAPRPAGPLLGWH
jgi:hypothetical protein